MHSTILMVLYTSYKILKNLVGVLNYLFHDLVQMLFFIIYNNNEYNFIHSFGHEK